MRFLDGFLTLLRTLIAPIKAKCAGIFQLISCCVVVAERGSQALGKEVESRIVAVPQREESTPPPEGACKWVLLSIEWHCKLDAFCTNCVDRCVQATESIPLVRRGIISLEGKASRLEARLTDKVFAVWCTYDRSHDYAHGRKVTSLQAVVRRAREALCAAPSSRVVVQLCALILQNVETNLQDASKLVWGRGLIYRCSNSALPLSYPCQMVSGYLRNQEKMVIAQAIQTTRKRLCAMGRYLLVGFCTVALKRQVVQYAAAYGYYGCHLLISQSFLSSTGLYESSEEDLSSWENSLLVGQIAAQCVESHAIFTTVHSLCKQIENYLQELQSQRWADSRCIKASQCEMVGETPCPLPRDTLWSKVVGAPKRLIRTSLRGAIPLFCPSPWIE